MKNNLNFTNRRNDERKILRDEQNRFISIAAKSSIKDMFDCLDTSFVGLDEKQVIDSRAKIW